MSISLSGIVVNRLEPHHGRYPTAEETNTCVLFRYRYRCMPSMLLLNAEGERERDERCSLATPASRSFPSHESSTHFSSLVSPS